MAWPICDRRLAMCKPRLLEVELNAFWPRSAPVNRGPGSSAVGNQVLPICYQINIGCALWVCALEALFPKTFQH